jgi:uridine kinase
MKTLNPRSSTHHRLIAIVGGSGSGKTWLAGHLSRKLDGLATRLSLDDFYLDHSHLPPVMRERINFDQPAAIDWPLFLQTLRDCRAGQAVEVPRYNFATHSRRPLRETVVPAPLVLVDGLWLLWQPMVRALFDFKIFLDCTMQLRLERRLARDVNERGRTPESVRTQFWKTVAPMHRRFIEPQSAWADLVMKQPPGEMELSRLIWRLQQLAPAPGSRAGGEPRPAVVPAGFHPAAAMPTT